MALNIKNDRVHRLARDAARRSGLSQTRAIEAALEMYLRVLDGQVDDRSARIRSILADFDERLTAADRRAVRELDLYDAETGLPR